MRLRAVEIAEFRGFAESQRIEFDPNVTVVHGANGAGKTSLFDSILWALAGSIPRLPEGHEEDVLSKYGDSGLARVRVELESASGRALAVTRTSDGTKSSLTVEDGGDTRRGADAQVALIGAMWPTGGLLEADEAAWSRALTRSVYLQQDDVRRFVESDSDSERFDVVAELLGVGRVTDLQHQLERQRQQWSKVSNERRAALEAERGRLAQNQSRLTSLREGPAPSLDTWHDFRARTRAILPEVRLSPKPDATSAAQELDTAVRALESSALTARRRSDSATMALTTLAGLRAAVVPPPAEEATLASRLARLDAAIQADRQALSDAQTRAAAERARLIAEHEAAEEQRALAALALRHLGERCPVCDQDYNRSATERRLRAFTEATEVPTAAGPGEIKRIAQRLAADEGKRVEIAARLDELKRLRQQRDVLEAEVAAQLAQLDVSLSRNTESKLSDIAQRASEQEKAAKSLVDAGHRLALDLARLGDRSAMARLEEASATSVATISREELALAARDKAGELASNIIEGLRNAADDIVSRQVAAMSPLLDRIYARIDPHPSFRSISLTAKTWRGRGRLIPRVSDSDRSVASDTPAVVLSSSQLNAVALSLFLTLNLGVREPPTSFVLLDDPLQSLDEINLLGVVDLLRRCKARRQLVISTHDRRFASLLQRKLRPVGAGESLVILRLDEWTRTGPRIRSVEVEGAGDPWRIVARAG